jgi:hypothetical protein
MVLDYCQHTAKKCPQNCLVLGLALLQVQKSASFLNRGSAFLVPWCISFSFFAMGFIHLFQNPQKTKQASLHISFHEHITSMGDKWE